MRNALVAGRKSAWRRLADPYLLWADHTGFRYFTSDRSSRFGVLAELTRDLAMADRAELKDAGIFVAQGYVGHRFISAELDVPKRNSQLNLIAAIGASHIELSTPVVAPRARGAFAPMTAGPQHEHLVGVIDDGCPFAHADLLEKQGTGLASRVEFLWDQDAVDPCVGSTASEYGYGCNFSGKALADAIRRGTPAGSSMPDEDAVYATAAQHRLRPLAGHGAHVLGLAAAHTPPKNRISPSRFSGSDATEPPSWKVEPGSDAALAFVQIPKDALDDSSGRWLGRHILDGLHALIEYAEKSGISRVTANVSYGPQTGPHDGSSVLERAIDALIADPRKVRHPKRKPIDELFVTVPIGNSYQSRAHAVFRLDLGGGQVAWRVPPDSETPAFLEVWLPRDTSLADVQVVAQSPDGTSLTADAKRIVQDAESSWQVVATNTADPGTTDQWAILVALGATGGFEDKPRPPHGRWTVTVRPLRQNVKDSAHAYVARNDYNLGGLRRGKLSHLWLESYDPERFMRSREYDPPETAPKLPVQICSAGSMSGLSTGARSSVAGGYRIADGAPAPYCSAGPSRDARKGGPDWAYPTDESRAFPGLNSWGNRSGASVRLVGTSAAAPQYARDIDIKGKAALPPPGEDPKNANPRLGFGRK